MFKTRVCDILGIEYPIVLAGMGGASTPELAAAVSNAGGLGVLGAAGCGPKQLRDWIRRTRELTDKPFGVDTLLPASVRRANYAQTRRSDADGSAAGSAGIRRAVHAGAASRAGRSGDAARSAASLANRCRCRRSFSMRRWK